MVMWRLMPSLAKGVIGLSLHNDYTPASANVEPGDPRAVACVSKEERGGVLPLSSS